MEISRRTLMTGAAGVGLGGLITLRWPSSLAEAALPTGQVAAVQRFRVGDGVVTAISDGYLDLDPSLLPEADPAEVARLLAEARLPDGAVRAAVNTYLINLGDQTILVDTGGAALLGPTLGNLVDNLASAGVAPEDIDVILLTHLHPDHIGGLAPDGSPVFPNAEIIVHQADIDFWSDETIMNGAPDAVKPFFVAAQGALAAYDGRITPFDKDGEVLSGIQAMHLPGHTPGHSGFLVDGEKPLLIWGDIVHAAPLQFPNPEWAIAFDTDQEQAIATRLSVFDMVDTDQIPVAGMHLGFPGVGHVISDGDSHRFAPMGWTYEL